MNFGPLNGEGGERRLNVLITRARLRCEVFTNLTADDIDLDRTRSRGVRALEDVPRLRARPAGSNGSAATEWARPRARRSRPPSMRRWTPRAARSRPRVGSAGFGARPGRRRSRRAGPLPARASSATARRYQSARSARDRDRLRPQVLEGLGWRLHRVWSTDWFRDPEGELHRVLAALDAAQGEEPSPDTPHPSTISDQSSVMNSLASVISHPTSSRDEPDLEREDSGAPEERPADIPPYELAELDVKLGGLELPAVSVARLASWMTKVVQVEGPVHVGEVARRVTEAAGVKRVGTRIQAALDSALAHAVRQGKVRRRGEFLWPDGMQQPTVRDRSALPAALRRLELIDPEEIARAVERVVADALGMAPEAVPLAACRLLGFARMSDEMRGRIDSIVAELMEARRLVSQGSHLVVPDPKPETT